jgi:hypothetical protein
MPHFGPYPARPDPQIGAESKPVNQSTAAVLYPPIEFDADPGPDRSPADYLWCARGASRRDTKLIGQERRAGVGGLERFTEAREGYR